MNVEFLVVSFRVTIHYNLLKQLSNPQHIAIDLWLPFS